MRTKNKLCLIVLGWSSFLNSVIACEKEPPQSPQVERLPSPRTTLGEVPHWDPQTRSLYYIDIHDAEDFKSQLLRYDFDENRVYSASIDGARTLLFILPIDCTKDRFLVGIDRTVVIAKWDGRLPKATVIRPLFELGCRISIDVESDECGKLFGVSPKPTVNRPLFEGDSGVPNVIINDVKTDERGRFYGGTRSVEKGEACVTNEEQIAAFYRYESGKCLKKLFGNITISNGLTWVRKTNKFYYIDSCTYDIKEFDYDPRTGDLSNGHRIISSLSLLPNGTKPDYIFDGMTNDRDGNLYVANYGANRISKFNPITGELVMEIELPATQVTSLAFGGPNLDILFVTTGNKDGKQPEGSGYLYKVTGLLAKGYAGARFRLFESCINRKLAKNKKCYLFCNMQDQQASSQFSFNKKSK